MTTPPPPLPRPRRPRLALPFTVVPDGDDTVRLVAGEDFRFTLAAPGLGRWLPPLLAQCDGRASLDDLLAGLGEAAAAGAREVVLRLYGERVLVDGTAEEAHRSRPCRLAAEGSGPLAERLRAAPTGDGAPLPVYCQDTLNETEALRFNRARIEENTPWLWASTAALSRAYVGPVFLPDAGPCLACLLGQLQALSPAPEVHAALAEHGRRGGAFAAADFPPEGVAILEKLVRWKARLLALDEVPAAAYRLHVLEADTFEVTAHGVFRDLECDACGEARR